jgi:hypothetical protein
MKPKFSYAAETIIISFSDYYLQNFQSLTELSCVGCKMLKLHVAVALFTFITQSFSKMVRAFSAFKIFQA